MPALVALTALNLSICWRLFKVEYTANFSSIEGSFIAIARYLSRHWGDSSWWPIWHCGMPYQDTYVPLLHLTVAATATVLHFSAARAYHTAIGVTYALGAPALYLLAVRLGARRGAAFLAAVTYSLFSPSALFMPGVAHDIGGIWYSRRLQVLTVYGEGPHISAMTLLPLGILALENALNRRTRRAFAWGAVAIALVFLTNVPGTMALGLAVFCWICAQSRDRLRAAWKLAAGAAALAYGLAAWGIPPSSLITVGGNIGPMHNGFSKSLEHGPVLLALALLATALAGYGLSRTPVPLVVRFALLFGGLVAPLAITARTEVFELLPQVGRLHLEAEMAVCLLFGWLAWAIYELIPRSLRPIVWALVCAPVFYQWQHYRWRAHTDIQPAHLEERSEYASARWVDRNRPQGRTYVGGSTAFWWNAFTGAPQLIGCCDQGLAMPVLGYAPYIVNSKGGPAETLKAKVWLEALGVETLVVNGATSTDEYKDIQQPERYRGVFPVLHEELGDTIYSVLPANASLAHVVTAGELVPQPARGAKVADGEVARYAAATLDASRPAATLTWIHGNQARIQTHLAAGELLSVQIAYFRGWHADVRGQHRAVSPDGLGFVTIHPECHGDCEILLHWDGSPDLWAAALLSLASLGAVLAMIFSSRNAPDLGVQ